MGWGRGSRRIGAARTVSSRWELEKVDTDLEALATALYVTASVFNSLCKPLRWKD